MDAPIDDGEHVLVALDGSPQADRALEHVLRSSGARVTVLTVIDPFDADPNTPGYQSLVGRSGLPGYSEEWYEGLTENAAALHERARERAADRKDDERLRRDRHTTRGRL